MSRLTTLYVRWQRFQQRLPEPDAAWHPGEFCHQEIYQASAKDSRVHRCDYNKVGNCDNTCHLFNGGDQRTVMDTLEQLMNQKEQ